MKHWILLILVVLLSLAPAAAWSVDQAAGVTPETTSIYRAAREQVDKLGATTAAQYAPEVINQAKESITLAQKGLEAGNERVTRESAERATLLAKLAVAVTEERLAAEKTAAAQKELTSLEQRLSTILAGKGEQP